MSGYARKPWDAYIGVHDEEHDAAFIAHSEDMVVIARIPPHETDEVRAIAKLIAAAPDLIKALEETQQCLIDIFEGKGGWDVEAVIQDSGAAISKAKGEQS